MTGILSYEERVRLERANGLRPENPCDPCGDSCASEALDLKGMTYETLGDTPVPLNRVCPQTKVVVPVTKLHRVTEDVVDLQATKDADGFRLVDFNACKGMNNLDAVHRDEKVTHAQTEATWTTRTEDTPYDIAQEVPVVSFNIKDTGTATQPEAVDGSDTEVSPDAEEETTSENANEEVVSPDA